MVRPASPDEGRVRWMRDRRSCGDQATRLFPILHTNA